MENKKREDVVFVWWRVVVGWVGWWKGVKRVWVGVEVVGWWGEPCRANGHAKYVICEYNTCISPIMYNIYIYSPYITIFHVIM